MHGIKQANKWQTLNKWKIIKMAIFCSIVTTLMLFLPTISLLNAISSQFQVLETGNNYTVIEFNLDEYELIPYDIDGFIYHRLSCNTHGLLMEEGLPEMPVFSTLLSVPHSCDVHLEEPQLFEIQTIKNLVLFPSQGFGLEIDEEKGFLKDEVFYQKNINYPEKRVLISEPAIMRDLRLVSLSLSPFVYNPLREKLTIVKRIVVRVSYDIGNESVLTNVNGKISKSFEPIYRSSVINYEQFLNRNPEYQKRSILVVRHHNAAITSLVEQFIEWKQDKGFIVRVVDTNTVSTAIAIKDYIKNAYNNWDDPPEYVVIFGGGSGSLAVPYWFAHFGPSDHPYTLLEGNDDLADIFIGRISVDSAYELATVWNKIRLYERSPYIDRSLNWHQNQLLVGDPRVSGACTINTSKYIKEIMNRRFENYTYRECYDGNFPEQINHALSQGVGFFSFRGLELMGGWEPAIDSGYHNGAKTPNATLITCNTLDFNGGKQVEPFFRVGTPTVPKGCVSAIGMTTNYTLTAFNSCLTGGIYSGIINDDIRTMGEALVKGKLYVWQVYGNIHSSKPPQYSHWANLIGDPSMDVWLQTPQTLNVSYEHQIPANSNFLSVTATDNNNNPLENVWITVRKTDNSLFQTDYTNSNGEIVFYFDEELEGNLKLTATKYDYIPHLGSVSIIEEEGISLQDVVATDELLAGKTIDLKIKIKNHNDRTVTNVCGTISCDDEYINIVTSSACFPDIKPQNIAESETSFVIQIAPNIPDKYSVPLALVITDNEDNSWTNRFQLTTGNADLKITKIAIENESKRLNPGDTANIILTLNNVGTMDIKDVYATISSDNRLLIIDDSTAFFGDIDVDGIASSENDYFVVTAKQEVIPGMKLELDLYLYNEVGFSQKHTVLLPIGDVKVTDPFGPDTYGYWCYDDGDIDYSDAPIYDWIEISPTKDGKGTNTGLESDFKFIQQVIQFDLPFTFRYYGIEYNEISICSNGWICFGITEQSSHKNWRLPGPLSPAAIVAAFWDNLSLQEGGVYTYYDATKNIFIIQWDNALNIMRNAPQTFQIIIYDPIHYTTITGDGPIKIQYKIFNNVNDGTDIPVGFDNWGNFATIGIADHTGSTGLEYTFNNVYPLAAKPLSDESAIYFTTGHGKPTYVEEEYQRNVPKQTQLFAAYPNPFNPTTTIGFYLQHPEKVSLTIYNIAGKKIKTVVDKQLNAGEHSFTWNGDDDNETPCSSGIYFYKLQSNTTIQSKKIVLLK